MVNSFDKARLEIRLKGQSKTEVSTKSITTQDIISSNDCMSKVIGWGSKLEVYDPKLVKNNCNKNRKNELTMVG